jgi:hypothetical protein
MSATVRTFEPSKYQKAIFSAGQKGDRNIVVNATAGRLGLADLPFSHSFYTVYVRDISNIKGLWFYASFLSDVLRHSSQYT